MYTVRNPSSGISIMFCNFHHTLSLMKKNCKQQQFGHLVFDIFTKHSLLDFPLLHQRSDAAVSDAWQLLGQRTKINVYPHTSPSPSVTSVLYPVNLFLLLFILWHVNGPSGICTLFNISITLSHKSYATVPPTLSLSVPLPVPLTV